jgi:hypothetical protein
MKAIANAPEGGPLPATALAKLEADPTQAANLRTTCVATLVKAARASTPFRGGAGDRRCRILPDETPGDGGKRIVETLEIQS